VAEIQDALDAPGMVEARAALREWEGARQDDPAIAASLYRTRMQAYMGGSLMVRAIEVPESLPRQVALDDSRPAFLRQRFDAALDSFLRRDLLSPDEFAQLSAEERARAFSGVRLASRQVAARAQALLDEALRDGLSIQDFRTRLEGIETSMGVTPSSPHYANTVYRTNVQQAYGVGRLEQTQRVAAFRPLVEYRTAGDERVRASHKALDRKVFNQVEDPGWAQFAPPLGYNCFPAGTLVQGRFDGGLRARYAGELVELHTHGGRVLRVTPNHPLATPDGFVAAGELRPGQHVLGYVGDAQGLAPGDVDPQQQPSRIEDVFDALGVRGRAVGLRPRAHDLHGDGAFTHGHVDVVGAAGELLLDSQAQSSQAGGEPVLAAPDASGVQEVGPGGLGLLGVALDPPAGGVPGGATLPLDGGAVGPQRSPLEPLRIGSASALDARLRQPAGDDATADSEFLRELVLAGSLDVAPDEIVRVERHAFSGHVYDLSTEGGWYVVQGIVSSNCRCSVVTLSPRRAAGRTVTASSSLTRPDANFAGPAAAVPSNVPPIAPTQPVAPSGTPPIDGLVGGDEEDWASLERVFGERAQAAPAAINRMTRSARVRASELEVWVDPEEVAIETVLAEPGGRRLGTMGRTIRREQSGQLVARHDYLFLDDQVQGQGIGREILREQFAGYDAIGVDRVDLQAVEVGRYTWARMGYQWDDETAAVVAVDFDHYLRGQGIPQSEATPMAEALSRRPADLARLEVNGQRVGKEFLLSGNMPNYRASLDLRDDEARRLALEYLDR
jgi:SPP1 gp7 family putative phage head morphogenesis protein